MLDLGWTELVLIGIVALIVVGPKDLPNMFRALGRFTGKARGMAREFSRAMESAADDAGVKEINKTLRAATTPVSYGKDRLREAAGLPGFKPGGATDKLSEERAEAKRKITEATAKAATERKAREAVAPETGSAARKDVPPVAEPVTPAAKAPAKPAAKAATKPAAKSESKAPAKPPAKAPRKRAAPKPASEPEAATKPTKPEEQA